MRDKAEYMQALWTWRKHMIGLTGKFYGRYLECMYDMDGKLFRYMNDDSLGYISSK